MSGTAIVAAMGRLPAFDDHRFVGTRDDMSVFDCDDDAEFALLAALAEGDELVEKKGLQSFGPDTAAEARNRGFRLP